MASRKTPPSKIRPSKVAATEKGAGKAAPGIVPASPGLGNIRDSIDAIDARIHALLNERARFAPSRNWSASPKPRRAKRWISTVPSAKRKFCGWRSSATKGRCAMKK
jgi:hypothetical protein